MNNFLSRIVDYRKAKGLTQKEMAEKLGIGQVSYSQIETGKTEISLQRIASIARILEVDLITLLFPDFNDAKYFQALKDENLRLKKINDLLIDYVDKNNNWDSFIRSNFPDIQHFFVAHKNLEEIHLTKLIEELKIFNNNR